MRLLNENNLPDFVVDDWIKNFLLVFTRERRFADEHFVDEYAQTPPVYRSGVTRLGQHLHLCEKPSDIKYAVTSGARNSGVPQNVEVRHPNPIPSLHKPKSAIMQNPSLSNNKLSSFKSR